ncbi:MAG: hypothetical protein IJ428_06945 [Clostridia bacterium]|nr:hypothetical protein [Clostridia bacterium]
MANFDSGVKAYITGECTVKVHFPIDYRGNAEVNCYQCKLFSRNTGVCQLTKEVSEYPTKYIGSNCPLIFSGEINDTKENLT